MAFILTTSFLSSMGIGLLGPVLPFLTQQYLSDPAQLASTVGWLASSYAICQFIAAPGLGALSDRYGRRPVLLVCLLGSALGYLLFGIGGALWLLFLARMIDGFTGGNISTIFAYVADITQPEERGKYFGLVGAAAGFGFIAGPAIGGLTARLGYTAPLYIAAGITLVNCLWGYFYLPESLDRVNRATAISWAQLSPIRQLARVLRLVQLRWLLLATFLYAFPFAALTTNLPVLVKDSLHWDADGIGLIFLIVGAVGILVQGGLLRQLLPRFGEVRLTIAGLICEIAGYSLFALLVDLPATSLLLAATVLFATGDGLIGPSLSGLLSRAVGAQEQGRVQGGSQSVQALARVLGPLVGGELYANLGAASPYWSSVGIVGLAIAAVLLALPSLRTGKHDH